MNISKFFRCLSPVVIVLAILGLNFKFNLVAFHYSGGKEGQFRVLTWNIHGFERLEEEKQSEVARLVIAQDADFVQLNEFTMDNCSVIDSLLSDYYSFKEESNAKTKAGDIIYSKIPFSESGKFKTGIPNKRVQALNVKISIEGDSLFLIGCHLYGNNYEGQIVVDNTNSFGRVKTFWKQYRIAQETRKEHAGYMKQVLLRNPLPCIVMGDMNDFSFSAPMDSLQDAGMKNAWWERGLGYGATYHEGWLKLRIDHVLYNEKLKLNSIKVVKTELSDHNILVADFSIAI